jgi:aminoglycoside 2''-phosphotransferase
MLIEHYQRIIAACFPELAIEHCAMHSEGWDSVAVAVNDDLIFRFPKRQNVEPQYQVERRLLPALAGALPLPIPDVAFFWPGGTAYPRIFIGHHLIHGAQLAAEHLTPGRIDEIARQLGQFLSALHRFPIEQAAQLGVPPGDQAAWRRRHQDQFEQIQSRVLPLLGQDAQARTMRDWQAFLDDGVHFQATLIHDDLAAEHILYDPAHGTVTGIIDWGDTAIGDPAIDFTGLLAAYGEDFMERVLAHYQSEIDASFRKRMRFYRDITPLNTVLFGLDTAQEQYVQEGLADYDQHERLETGD